MDLTARNQFVKTAWDGDFQKLATLRETHPWSDLGTAEYCQNLLEHHIAEDPGKVTITYPKLRALLDNPHRKLRSTTKDFLEKKAAATLANRPAK
jgi:hypothetical protein